MDYNVSKLIENVRLIVLACGLAHKPKQVMKDRIDIICNNHYLGGTPLEDVQVYDVMMFYIIAEEYLEIKAELYCDPSDEIYTLVFQQENDCRRFAKFFSDCGFSLKSEPANAHFDKATIDDISEIVSEVDLELVLESVPTCWGFQFCARYGNC